MSSVDELSRANTHAVLRDGGAHQQDGGSTLVERRVLREPRQREAFCHWDFYCTLLV